MGDVAAALPDDLQGILAALPSQGFGFMLVLCRVGTAMLTGPALGEADIPPTIRAALAIVFALLVFSVLRAGLPPLPPDVPALAGTLVLEIAVGAWMGFLTRVVVGALGMAGGMVSLMVGLSSVLQLDPSIGGQATALQRMLSLVAIALLFATGLYILPIQAILGTYEIIPPGPIFGGAAFDTGAAAQLVTATVAESFALSLRLAAPFIITGMVWQAAMGVMSRLVPNIQVHVVSAPAQIVGGLAILMGAIALMLSHWSASTAKSFSLLPGL